MTQLEKGNHTWLYFEAGILQKNILSVQFCPEQTRSRKKAQVAEAASTEQPITHRRHQLLFGQTDIYSLVRLITSSMPLTMEVISNYNFSYS